jgi:hypothetical protein
MVRESVDPTAGLETVGKRNWDAAARNRTPCDKSVVDLMNGLTRTVLADVLVKNQFAGTLMPSNKCLVLWSM